MAEFELNVLDIDEAGKDYDFPLTASWIAASLADAGVKPGAEADGALTLRAHRQGRDVVVSGRLSAELVAECARCLGDAPIHVDSRFASLLTARAAEIRPVADELELTPEDLDRDFYSGDTIVLDGAVREHLLLEVPMQLLCAEDCAGIAVPPEVAGPADLRALEAGSNGEAVDPRLAPLMKLVSALPAEGGAGPAEES